MTSCFVMKGDLPVKIHWTFDNKQINQFDGITAVNTNKRASQLTIESVQDYHRGEYKCVAENRAGVAEFATFLNVNGILHDNSYYLNVFLFLMVPYINQPSFFPPKLITDRHLCHYSYLCNLRENYPLTFTVSLIL
jgi:hypothetical protein